MANIITQTVSWIKNNIGFRSTTYRQPIMDVFLEAGSGVTVNEKTTISITSVFRGLSFIAGAIAAMPKRVVEEDEDENLTFMKNHPLQRLLSIETHPTCTPYDFFFALIWQCKFRGNGLAHIIIDPNTNRPTGLRIIPWREVLDIKEDIDNQLVTYHIQGYSRRLFHYEVIHIKNATDDGVCGLDTLKVHKETFGVELAGRKVISKIYKNGALLSGALSTDGKLTPDQREAISKSWKQRYGGPDNAGETALLEGGVRYQRIALTPAESGINESRQFNVYEAARVLGLSPHVLYALDRANFSNIETLHQEIGKYTLAPIVESLEQELRRKLFRIEEQTSMRIVCNMDAFTRGDTESRSKYLKEMVQNGVFSINEARRMEGKNSVPFGNSYLIPMNMNLVNKDGKVVLEGKTSGSSKKDDDGTIGKQSKSVEHV